MSVSNEGIPLALATVMGSRGLILVAHSTIPGSPSQFLDFVAVLVSIGFLRIRQDDKQERR